MRKCALHNLGCKVNSYETQAMQQMMENAGYDIIPFGEESADIYIINTCSVTNMADRKSRQMIHKARKLNPDAVIVATGCYVESAGEMVDEDIDIMIGNNEKSRLIDMLNGYFANDVMPEMPDISGVSEFDSLTIKEPSEHTRAYVKIQDGCNRFCSYCIIPYVRGRIRSRKEADVLNEINNLAKSGCKEVVLTGIHLSSYGMDGETRESKLIDIIEKINAVEGIERIRLGSLEPLIVDEEFTKRLKACNKVCPHFHLSLQSGCDKTLKRMNRRYTAEQFENGVNILRKYYDNPAITTDVIVGFPQETEEEFNETYEFLKKIQFYELHVFKYSRRKGTVADKMPGQIEESIKSKRSDLLLAMDSELSEEYRKSYIGKNVRILTEETVQIGDKTYMTGFTDSYVKVLCDCLVTNAIVDVTITELMGKDMVKGVVRN